MVLLKYQFKLGLMQMLFRRILAVIVFLVVLLVSYACYNHKSMVVPAIIATVVFPSTYFITKYGQKKKQVNLAIRIFAIACLCGAVACMIGQYMVLVF